MSQPQDPRSPAATLPAPLLNAWLAQSHDLLALTDSTCRIAWCNAAFERSTGIGFDSDLLSLAAPDWQDGVPRRAMLDAFDPLDALGADAPADIELTLRARHDGSTLWMQARASRVDDSWLWTFRDITHARELGAREQRLSELLDMAQEFGRLGVWEREIPSGEGRWDRHVFGFWGMDPAAGTPNYAEAASRIHPDDQGQQIYRESTQKAGRYSQRYRVIQPDGSVRWIHSQWEVKNSPGGQPDRTIGIMVDDTQVYELARSLDSTTAQLRLAAELGNIIYWRHDLATDLLHFNEHGFKVLRVPYRPGGIALEALRAFTHPDDLPKLVASAAQALASNGPVDVETRHRWPDGTWRYMLLRRVVERNASGEAVAFLGVSLDITDQVQPARRAEQLARRLEAAAQAAHVGIWTTALGSLKTEWNAQMFQLFDVADTRRPPLLDDWVANSVHPDDALRVAREAGRCLRGEDGDFEIEFRTRPRDGRVRWMVLRAHIDRANPDGARVLGIAMDVTDRHEALTALHAASERAALIAHHAGIGTWETDEHGLPALWDEQMFRLRGLEPRPQALERDERLEMVHPDDRGQVLDSKPGVNASTQTTAYEFRVRWPDGNYRWLASRSAALCDEHGTVVRRVGVNWDITEAKNADLARQQALLAARESQAKSQFLSHMSHELRTPMNAVLGFTQLLQIEARESHATDRLAKLDHIRVAGEHLLTLINDALDLSRLETGTLKLDLRTVSLADAVAKALSVVADLASAHGVSVQAGKLDGFCRADPMRLQQVLHNLLTNAIKYNRPGGHVSVESAVADDRVRLQVRDSGHGIRSDRLEELFEPFNRLGLEHEGIEGSGIGLTIVKALIEGMSGAVDVRSEVGKGSVFEITLPTAQRHNAASNTRQLGPVSGGTEQRERNGQLLYIEDNGVNVLLVEELVKSLVGLRIVCETTGTAGVARARSLRPDVILVDMQLPDFDGFEVLKRLREHPETAAIPCIALSANAMPDDIERGLAGGFDDYWTKPIKFQPFIESLERLFPIEPVATPLPVG